MYDHSVRSREIADALALFSNSNNWALIQNEGTLSPWEEGMVRYCAYSTGLSLNFFLFICIEIAPCSLRQIIIVVDKLDHPSSNLSPCRILRRSFRASLESCFTHLRTISWCRRKESGDKY